MKKQALECLGNRVNVIYDATNINEFHMFNTVTLIKNNFPNFRVIGFWLDIPLGIALKRNAERQRQVPEETIKRMGRELRNKSPLNRNFLDILYQIKAPLF